MIYVEVKEAEVRQSASAGDCADVARMFIAEYCPALLNVLFELRVQMLCSPVLNIVESCQLSCPAIEA